MKQRVLLGDMEEITQADLAWDQLQNKTILVSGANGFLPAYLIESLLYLNEKKSLNIKIIGLVRNQEKAICRFKDYLTRSDFQLLIQDVCQSVTINKKINYIIHAASQASPKYFGIDPVGTLSANVLGTHYLLELAKTHKIEGFLYFSSSEIYGEVAEVNLPICENYYGPLDPLKLRSCYAESKRMGENMCISYAHQFDMTVKIVRPFHIYGPGLKLNDQRVFSDFIADIVHNRDIQVRSEGSAVRAFCYLTDATIGFFTVLFKGKRLEAYNIGNPVCCYSIYQLADKLVEIFKDRNLSVVRKFDMDNPNYLASTVSRSYPDISKAMKLGWQPKISINEGFRRTVRSFDELA